MFCGYPTEGVPRMFKRQPKPKPYVFACVTADPAAAIIEGKA